MSISYHQLKNLNSAINTSENSEVLRVKISLRPPLKNVQQRIDSGRQFLCLVIPILNTYGGQRWSMFDVWQPLSAPLLFILIVRRTLYDRHVFRKVIQNIFLPNVQWHFYVILKKFVVFIFYDWFSVVPELSFAVFFFLILNLYTYISFSYFICFIAICDMNHLLQEFTYICQNMTRTHLWPTLRSRHPPVDNGAFFFSKNSLMLFLLHLKLIDQPQPLQSFYFIYLKATKEMLEKKSV